MKKITSWILYNDNKSNNYIFQLCIQSLIEEDQTFGLTCCQEYQFCFFKSMILLLDFGAVLAVWYYLFSVFYCFNMSLPKTIMISWQTKKLSNRWNIHMKNSNAQIHLKTLGKPHLWMDKEPSAQFKSYGWNITKTCFFFLLIYR